MAIYRGRTVLVMQCIFFLQGFNIVVIVGCRVEMMVNVVDEIELRGKWSK